MGKSSLPVTDLFADISRVPSGTMRTGILEGTGSRLGTLIGCGVPSISSGGISVVSGMLPAVVTAESGGAVILSLVEPLSPHPIKNSALETRIKSVIFFIVLCVFK